MKKLLKETTEYRTREEIAQLEKDEYFQFLYAMGLISKETFLECVNLRSDEFH